MIYHRKCECKRCGHKFMQAVNVVGEFDGWDGPMIAKTCEVCTSKPYKDLKKLVKQLSAQNNDVKLTGEQS